MFFTRFESAGRYFLPSAGQALNQFLSLDVTGKLPARLFVAEIAGGVCAHLLMLPAAGSPVRLNSMVTSVPVVACDRDTKTATFWRTATPESGARRRILAGRRSIMRVRWKLESASHQSRRPTRDKLRLRPNSRSLESCAPPERWRFVFPKNYL